MSYLKESNIYFLRGGDDRLLSPIQQTQIFKVAKARPSQKSFYIYNEYQTELRLNAWKRDLPNITPHYAVKSNPSSCLIQNLNINGIGMDCASENQIKQCLNLGIAVENIIYSNPTKCEEDIIYAHGAGITITVADTIHQILKIRELAPELEILWRISVEENKEDNLGSAFSHKFGDNFENEKEIEVRMNEIKDMGVNLKGIHFHCGSGMQGSTAFNRGVELARKCIIIGRKLGHQLSILDVGGGFPAGKIKSHVLDPLNEISFCRELKLKVVAEPGRYLCSKSFYLLTRVIGKKFKNGRYSYFLNDSIYHSFRCTETDSFYLEKSTDQFYSKISSDEVCSVPGETHVASLVGMTCDGTDIITKEISVPNNLKIGDWLCIGGCGAYTISCRGNFNGMEISDKIITMSLELPEDQS